MRQVSILVYGIWWSDNLALALDLASKNGLEESLGLGLILKIFRILGLGLESSVLGPASKDLKKHHC